MREQATRLLSIAVVGVVAQRRIVAVNVGSEDSVNTEVRALPGFFLEDDAQLWIDFLQNHTDPTRDDIAEVGDYDITYSFSWIQSINGQPSSEAALIAVPVDGTTGAATWSIGDVITSSENDLVVVVRWIDRNMDGFIGKVLAAIEGD